MLETLNPKKSLEAVVHAVIKELSLWIVPGNMHLEAQRRVRESGGNAKFIYSVAGMVEVGKLAATYKVAEYLSNNYLL